MWRAQTVAPSVIIDRQAANGESDRDLNQDVGVDPGEERDDLDDEDDAEIDVDDDDADTDTERLDPEFDTDEMPDENLSPPRTPLGPR